MSTKEFSKTIPEELPEKRWETMMRSRRMHLALWYNALSHPCHAYIPHKSTSFHFWLLCFPSSFLLMCTRKYLMMAKVLGHLPLRREIWMSGWSFWHKATAWINTNDYSHWNGRFSFSLFLSLYHSVSPHSSLYILLSLSFSSFSIPFS